MNVFRIVTGRTLVTDPKFDEILQDLKSAQLDAAKAREAVLQQSCGVINGMLANTRITAGPTFKALTPAAVLDKECTITIGVDSAGKDDKYQAFRLVSITPPDARLEVDVPIEMVRQRGVTTQRYYVTVCTTAGFGQGGLGEEVKHLMCNAEKPHEKFVLWCPMKHSADPLPVLQGSNIISNDISALADVSDRLIAKGLFETVCQYRNEVAQCGLENEEDHRVGEESRSTGPNFIWKFIRTWTCCY